MPLVVTLGVLECKLKGIHSQVEVKKEIAFALCHRFDLIRRLTDVVVRTLDLRLSVAGSVPGHDTACLFLMYHR